MDKIKEKYQALCYIHSDINEHLPTLYNYAKECNHITEFGVRFIVSTWAFLASQPKKMVSYDIVEHTEMQSIVNLAKDNGIDYSFLLGDTLKIEIEETDLLFIDTLHIYEQLKSELEKHSNKVKKYIILHDTTTFGVHGEKIYNHASKDLKNTSGKGLWFAVEEFLNKNTEWKLSYKFENNNGLTILKRDGSW